VARDVHKTSIQKQKTAKIVCGFNENFVGVIAISPAINRHL
jgi:hypothetical protein